jgi:ketosteroid isomerase-like protein
LRDLFAAVHESGFWHAPRNPHGDTIMSDAIKAEIKKLEDRRFEAMIDSDFDTLDKLLGEDLIYTHSTAQSDTRAEYIALCKKGVFKYLKIERPIENIQVYGDTVVVTSQTKMDAIVEGKPKPLNSRYTNVWVKGAKGWQMVVWQSTPIPVSTG